MLRRIGTFTTWVSLGTTTEEIAHAGEVLNRAEGQGYIDVRIMLPPRKA